MPLIVDRAQFPLLQLTYVGDFSDAELQQFFREIEAALALPGKKAAIIDLRAATAGNAVVRKLQAEWIRANERVLARDFVAAAIVTDNAIIRGAVTAVFWIRPLPLPTHVTATIGAAHAWLAPYLERAR